MSKRSRTEYSLLNIFSNFAGYGLNLLLSFICRIVFVRCLSAEYLGINGLFTNVLTMLSLTELGIGSAIVYALYKPIAEEDEDKIASLMSFYGKAYRTIGIVVMILGLALLPFIKFVIGTPPNIPENIYLIYFIYLFNSASSYFLSFRSTILIAHQRNYVNTTINYIVVIFQNIIQMAVLLIWKSYMAYLLVWAACSLITNILISRKAKHDYAYITKKDVKPLSREEKRGLFKNIKALTVVKLSGMLVNSTDNIVITYFNGLVSTGIASNYLLLTGILTSLLSMVFNGTTASVGNLIATEDDETKYQFFKRLFLLSFWLYGWATIGIILVSGDMVQFFFGEEYVLPAIIPLILAVNFYMTGMLNTAWTYKNAMGLFRYGQYILLFTAALNIIGDIILGKHFGIAGIFAATAIARLFTNAWYDPYAIFKHGLKRNPVEYYKLYAMYLVVLAFTGGICSFFCNMVGNCNLWTIIIKILICSVVSNVVFFAVFRKTSEFQYLLGIIKRLNIKTKNS